MNRSGISWLWTPDGRPGYSWSPTVGCSHASPGCVNCYAERLVGTRLRHLPAYAGLTKQTEDGPQWSGEARIFRERLTQPLHAQKGGNVFVCNMSDLFHASVPFETIAKAFAVMCLAPQHTFYVLTKRADVMAAWFDWAAGGRHVWEAGQEIRMPRGRDKHAPRWPFPNVRLGVTVENQAMADERIPRLLRCPAAARFLSVEPMLEAIDLDPYLTTIGAPEDRLPPEQAIAWVICGGESGPEARLFESTWAAKLLEQCRAAGVAFYMKQGQNGGPIEHMEPSLRVRQWPALEVANG